MSKSYDKAIAKLNKIISDGIKNGTPFGDIQREIMKQQAEEVKAAKQWKDPGQINAYSSSIAQKLQKNKSEIEKATKNKRIKDINNYNNKRISFTDAMNQQKKGNQTRMGGLKGKRMNRGNYQSAPAFDSFPKESQVKDHPLYGNLRY